MIVSVERLKTISELQNLSDDELLMMQDAIEDLVRSYTNNNFQNRNFRIEAESSDNKIRAVDTYFFKVGDTVQISGSINDGLYVVTAIDEDGMTLNKDLYDWNENTVTKIVYPATVVQGVINMMKWEVTNRNKVGIQSETISRHSVTYFSQDANNQVMGYPVTLLGFLQPFKKARF